MLEKGMSAGAAGTEVAVILMLRQLYVLVGKLHGADSDGLAAWRDDLERELRARLSPQSGPTDGALKAALETVQGVFHTITDPR